MMPKRGFAALLITTGVLVLLLSFKTPDVPLQTTANDAAIVAPQASARVPTSTRPGATGAPATSAPAASAATGSGSTTIDGPVVSMRFGDVQVEVVVAGGRIQDVIALQLPTGRRSGQISGYSGPILRSEALQAQSANIDTVSGATYTSQAYEQSLQGALDQAGIG